MQFERGAKVRLNEEGVTVYGLRPDGKVTHLSGDPPDEQETHGYRTGSNERWVTWQDPAHGSEWIEEEYLEAV